MIIFNRHLPKITRNVTLLLIHYNLLIFIHKYNKINLIRSFFIEFSCEQTYLNFFNSFYNNCLI
jgi:hypothetical protein